MNVNTQTYILIYRYLILVLNKLRYQVLDQKLRFEYLQKRGDKQGTYSQRYVYTSYNILSSRNRYLFEH